MTGKRPAFLMKARKALTMGSAAVVLGLFFCLGYGTYAPVAKADFSMGSVTHTDDEITDDPDDITLQDGFCTPGTYYPSQWDFCDIVGTTKLITNNLLYKQFHTKIKKVSKNLQSYLYGAIDTVVYNGLERQHVLELDMIQWWKTMWYYQMRPGMQAQTEQIGTATVEQTKDILAQTDSQQNIETQTAMEHETIENHQTHEPDDRNGCPTATVSGGIGRAHNIRRFVQVKLQDDALSAGYNKVGTPGAGGRAAYLKYQADLYEKITCDPTANNGQAGCAATVPNPNPLANADTRVTEMVSNTLTIPVDDATPNGTMTTGQARKVALQQSLDNLVGPASADPMDEQVIKTSVGQYKFMQRRSFLARNAAARSVPQFVAGLRMPGTRMAQYVNEIRKQTGETDATLSKNPSYLEAMHALTIDTFNSGKYAFNSIEDENKVEMEKLRLSSFYSMLLRDYYELLERMALTLSVQVSVMADQIPLDNLLDDTPVKRN